MEVKRPWGGYKVVSYGQGYLVKRLVVNPNERLSLQSHKWRMEHWVVIEGKALVEIGECESALTIELLKEGDHIVIDYGFLHRLQNVGNTKLVIIEVQLGDCRESDIIRYDDDYGRISKQLGKRARGEE